MQEKINPEYYKNKSIETFEAIASQLSPLETIGLFRGQILKYMMRFGEKENGSLDASITDASKAHWYLEKLIKYLNDLKKEGGSIEAASNVSELFKDKKWK